MSARFVTPALFRFLAELSRHNDREWFNANKDRYLAEVRDPLLGFVSAIAPKLSAISPQIVADPRPSGGSLLRIYRDTRFSRDKTPYKTNAGLWFRVGADKDVEGPGYYLHLAPGQVFMAAGMWHPSSEPLRAVRESIVKDPQGWRRATRSRLSHEESTLKRPPRGFDPAHPLIEDLKRTSFTVGESFTERQACASSFPMAFVTACRREAPLVRFLSRAVGLSF
jgi:uncharacterized protein (TIGR02453 family)